MGSCLSANVADHDAEEGKQRNKEIEKQLKEDKAKEANIERVLLLGAGDSVLPSWRHFVKSYIAI